MVRYIEDEAEWATLMELSKERPVIVDFTASWCGPCRYIAPTFEALDKENPDVEFVKVDVDENEAVAALCGISAMPTFQTYKSGSKVSEMRGANVDGLKQMIANSK